MRRAIATGIVLLSAPAAADVVRADADGFEIASTVTIVAPPRRVWDVLHDPARWWSSDHTYSGDAKNLSIDPRAGGCYCETLPGKSPADGGSVEHARVIFAKPPATLRLTGAFGPLQAEAVTGTLTFKLTPQGTATKVTMTYVVGGYIRGGAQPIAPMVDSVLSQQLAGLKAAAAQ